MYTINKLPYKILASTTEVIAYSPMEANADIKIVTNSLKTAETAYVVPVIGWGMYNDILNQKNVQITADNQTDILAALNTYQTEISQPEFTNAVIPVGTWINAAELLDEKYTNLWWNYLMPMTTYAVYLMTMAPNFVRNTATGMEQFHPKTLTGMAVSDSGSTAADLKSLQYVETSMRQQLETLKASLEYFLVNNNATYPLYVPAKSVSDDGFTTSGTGGIFTNAYADEIRNKKNSY